MKTFGQKLLFQQTFFGGSLIALAWCYLAIRSSELGTATLTDLLSVTLFSASVSGLLWLQATKSESQLDATSILAFALIFRVIGFFTFPVLEDDFYRFIWDGYRTVLDGSAYGVAPSNFFGNELPERLDAVLDGINYPDIATIYGPTNQWLFYLSYVAGDGAIWPLKAMLLLADVAIILILKRVVSTNILMLYAWSPLVIKEFVISVHPDLWGAMFVLFALICYQRKQDSLMGVWLALAIGVKPFALIILPFLFLWRWRAWFSFFVTATVIALPFGIRQSWLPDGLSAMSSNWLFNAPLYELLSLFFALETIKIVLLGIFTLGAAVYGLRWACLAWKDRKNDGRPIPRGDLLFAALLICLPAFNPWYAIWLVPFALYWPRAWVWIASVCLMLSYASGINLPSEYSANLAEYQHPSWILILEFGLIAVAFSVDAIRRRSKKKSAF